jgi:MFS family permease
LLKLREDLTISDIATAWIVGITKLGAVLGTYIGGAIMYKYGRSQAVGHISAFFIGGPLLMATAGTVLQLVMGRLVIGLGVGASAVVVPAFLAEMAPPDLRGMTVSSYEGMICMGMLVSLLVDAALQVCLLCGLYLHATTWHVCFPRLCPGLLCGLYPNATTWHVCFPRLCPGLHRPGVHSC